MTSKNGSEGKRKLWHDFDIEFIVYDETASKYEDRRKVYFRVYTPNIPDRVLTSLPYSYFISYEKNKFKKKVINCGLVDNNELLGEDDWLALYTLLKEKLTDFETKESLTGYKNTYKIERSLQINFVDEGFKKYNYYFHQLLIDRKIAPYIYYAKDGDSEEFYKRFKELFEKDKPFQLLVSFSLLQFLRSSERYSDLSRSFLMPSENPVLILVGMPKSGKTIRLNTMMSLWARGHTNPTERVYSFAGDSKITEGFIAYILPTYRMPIVFDDLEQSRDRRFIKNLDGYIRALANGGPIRYVAHKAYYPKPFYNVFFFSLKPQLAKSLFEHYKIRTAVGRHIMLMFLPEQDDLSKNSEIRELFVNFQEYSAYSYGHVDLFDQYLDAHREDFKTYFNQVYEKLKVYYIDDIWLRNISSMVALGVLFSRFLNLDYTVDYFIDLVFKYFSVDIDTKISRFERDLFYIAKPLEETINKHKIVQSVLLKKFLGGNKHIYKILELIFSNTSAYKDEEKDPSYYHTFSDQNNQFYLYTHNKAPNQFTEKDYLDALKSLLYNLDRVLFERKSFAKDLKDLLVFLRESLDLRVPVDTKDLKDKPTLTHIKEHIELAYYLLYIYVLLLENKDQARGERFLDVFYNFLTKYHQGKSDVQFTLCDLIDVSFIEALKQDIARRESLTWEAVLQKFFKSVDYN